MCARPPGPGTRTLTAGRPAAHSRVGRRARGGPGAPRAGTPGSTPRSGQPAGPPRLEHHRGDHPGQDGRLGAVEQAVGQCLGHQQIRLVVDARAGGGRCRSGPVPHVLSAPPARPPGGSAGARAGQVAWPATGRRERRNDLVGRVLVEAARTRLDGQVVGGAGRPSAGREPGAEGHPPAASGRRWSRWTTPRRHGPPRPGRAGRPRPRELEVLA